MFQNYLKIAWRNLSKNKVFSTINIVGLAIGLGCFLLISLYVIDELSYDRFNENADRIYRVDSDIIMGGTQLDLAVASDPMGATLKKDYPQVEAYTRFYKNGSIMIKKGTAYIDEPHFAHADSTLFDVFTFPLIEGDPKKALTEPYSVVLSETTAKKYFGTTDVVGKSIETNERENNIYKITGVMKDIPHNSHINLDVVMSMHNVDYEFGTYLSNNFPTYVLLKPGVDYREFNKNFLQIIDKYIIPQAAHFMDVKSKADFERSGNKIDIYLMPLLDIHLRSDKMAEMGVNGNIQYVYIFSAVALLILLIACINFMNLSTARSANRAKEVGIRKVLGTEKKMLIRQFLLESMLMAYIALAIGLIIASLALTLFNDVSGKELTMSSLLNFRSIAFFILLPVVVGIIAGSYPAFYLSSFRPIAVLKGKISTGFKKSNVRNALVVFQFATTIILIVGTIVIYRQLNYIQNKNLGFKRDQLLIVNNISANGRGNANVFKDEVAKMPGVLSSSFAGYLPVSNSSRSDNTFSKDAVMDTKNSVNMQTWNVDYNYIGTMGMEIVNGRNFSPEYGSDSSAIIINETTASVLGYADPIGKKIYSLDREPDGKMVSVSYTIVGVVKNFHYESLRENVGPLLFRLGNNYWAAAFKVSTQNIQGLVKNIEAKFKTISPGTPFEYQFLDESFDNMYRTEQRAGKVAFSFALLAIMIACLGLFGLATYMAEQRAKEIGVRKVLGASVQGIINMLSQDFLRLVVIAMAIGFPLAWLMMHKWLEGFAFRTNIGWWIFLLAAFITALITIVTVSTQAIKAAIANPVKSLRTE
jgi:putative ABC transport system permease protein